MPEDRVDRRLAAIFAGDIAGYSRLMGVDEEGTLRQLKAHHKELVDPKITEHRGRIVKTTGDGMLVEFFSVVDAVRCAVDIQRGMAERNAGVSADKRIEFRIGINVGDIIIDGDDIFGDGVNVAARLEALADPGGIMVSGVVHDQVRDKLSFDFEDLGEQAVKNIARPVGVHRVQLTEPVAAGKLATAAGKMERTVSDRPSSDRDSITADAQRTASRAAASAINQRNYPKGVPMLRTSACLVAVLLVAGSFHTASAQTTTPAPAASSAPAAAKPSRMKLTADKLRDMKAKWLANKGKLKACRKEVKAKGLVGDDRWFYIEDCMDKT